MIYPLEFTPMDCFGRSSLAMTYRIRMMSEAIATQYLKDSF